MNSIERLRQDFDSQKSELATIHNEKLFEDCIFVGSGDSFVAGLITEYMTDHRCICSSPSDLFNSKFGDNKTYCFVSVSGRTRSNIDVARRAAMSGADTIAVTMNPRSELARVCKNIVPLLISRSNTPTAGFSTFVANVVTCLQLAGVKVPQKFNTWHNNGIKLARKVLESMTVPNQPVFILGNNILYALALYGSLQIAEFFGSTAIAHKLEEFCHSPIFGIRKAQYIWMLGHNEEKISKRISKLGLDMSYFELYNKDIFTQLFESIFFLQSLMLLLAEKYGYTELQYVMMKDILAASSDLIYRQ